MTRSEDGAVSSSSKVTLREISESTVRAICALETTPAQRKFVAPNAISIAQAYFWPRAWFRAIYADEEPVGFVLLHDDPEKQEYFLGRFMIDTRYQHRGLGAHALRLLIEHVRSRPGATELLTSVVPHPDGPQPFYEKFGFVATGDLEAGEAVLRLKLTP